MLAKLRAAGLEENTLIFFLSDNGGPIGNAANGSQQHSAARQQGRHLEGGIRVPFLVQWKGKLPAGKVYDQPVIQLDIHADRPGRRRRRRSKPEWKLDGVNLLPYLDGKNAGAPHDALYWRFGEQMAIRKGDWKLVRADLATDKQFGDIAKKPMLFNLADDIGEKNDLADAQPEKVKELAAGLAEVEREGLCRRVAAPLAAEAAKKSREAELSSFLGCSWMRSCQNSTMPVRTSQIAKLDDRPGVLARSRSSSEDTLSRLCRTASG